MRCGYAVRQNILPLIDTLKKNSEKALQIYWHLDNILTNNGMLERLRKLLNFLENQSVGGKKGVSMQDAALQEEQERAARLIVEGTRLLTTRIPALFETESSDITFRQWEALKIVLASRSPEISLADITSYMGYSRQNVKKLVSGLERAGYVTLRPSHIDGRALRVEATRKARREAPHYAELEQRMFNSLFEGVQDTELSVSARTMATMIRNVAD